MINEENKWTAYECIRVLSTGDLRGHEFKAVLNCRLHHEEYK